MTKVAVTGAGGFLGSHVCRALLERGHEVIAVARTGSPRHVPSDVAPHVYTRTADVLDAVSVFAALDGVEAVVHCAALVDLDGLRADAMRATNAAGPRNVLQACGELGIERLVHISSVHAFTKLRGAHLTDRSPLGHTSPMPYTASKAAGHQAILAAATAPAAAARNSEQASASGAAVASACIICPGAIIGPLDDRPSAAGRLVLDIARRKLPMFVRGGFWWVDVRDVAAAAASATTDGTPGAVYFTPGTYASISELARLCSSAAGRNLGRPAVPWWLAAVSLPVVRLYAAARRLSPLYTSASLRLLGECPASIDVQQAAADLGYAPRPLSATIGDTIASFRDGDLLQ